MKAIEEQPQANLDVFGVRAVIGAVVDAQITLSVELARCYTRSNSDGLVPTKQVHRYRRHIWLVGTCAVMRSPDIQNPLPNGIPHRRFCEVTKQPPDFYREKPGNILISHSVL